MKHNNGLMSEVEAVALVIGVILIPVACVRFKRNHTYMRDISHLYLGGDLRSIMVFIRRLTV